MASTIPIIAGVAIVLSTSDGSLAQTSAAAPRRAAQDSDFSERARQDREIVYFLHAPETHSFSLYHDVTIKDVGRSTYVNVVRAGSKVSNPSAVCLDTGEALKVETLKGDEITKAKIDIGEPVKPESEAVVVRFTPVAAGTTTRIRIRETYTDPARYRLEGDQLVWDRSFGRPQNAVILPDGWALEGSAFPARITLTDDNRIRLDFTNPRNDEVRALILARKPRAADVGGTAAVLRARIAPPHDETVAAYRQSGAVNASAHPLTDREWALVERAIADLPPLHRDVLEQRLARLSFIDAPSSAGTALTRSFDGPDGGSLFDITIRADVLDKSLSEFLTEKESMLFADDGSGYSVRLSAGRAPALTYLLLHEATHVVDRTFGVSAEMRPFRALWVDYRDLAAPYATGPMAVTTYRRGQPIPLADSPELYKALGASPFVSLYATASAGEDLAELAAWSHLSRLNAPLTVEVRDAKGRVAVTVEPLRSPAVQARFAVADAVLARASAKSSQTP